MGNLSKYNAAYINALVEEGTRQDLIDWLIKLHRENVDLREDKRRLDTECATLRQCMIRPEEEIGISF
jgi:thiamine phosphate synthase YjbQ (UPF0047 family)